MNLSRKIAAAVDERAAAGEGPGVVEASNSQGAIRIALELATPAGITCSAITYQVGDPGQVLAIEALRAWGQRLSDRLTYLMEPVEILEADRVSAELLIRSREPSQRDGKRSYYEIRLGRGAALVMTRQAFDDATRKRAPIACQLTREALERLVDDLEATAPALA
jgi:hypothetical protein